MQSPVEESHSAGSSTQLGLRMFFFAVGGFLVSGILLMVPVVALVFAINSFETVQFFTGRWGYE